MTKRTVLRIVVAIALAIGTAAITAAGQTPGGAQYAGMWSGTYDGAGSGQFDMTLDKGANGMTGKVNVTTEGGNYSADFKSVSFDGAKMTATYDFPLDPSAEIVMTATFDGSSAKGTWSLRTRGQTDELAGGGIAITRK